MAKQMEDENDKVDTTKVNLDHSWYTKSSTGCTQGSKMGNSSS